MGKGVAIAVVATALILIAILAIAMNTQRHHYRGTSPGIWEIKLDTLHKTSTTTVKTVNLGDVAVLTMKGSKAYLHVNLTAYKGLWFKENGDKHCAIVFTRQRELNVCFTKENITFKVYKVGKDIPVHGVLTYFVFEVPVPKLVTNYSGFLAYPIDFLEGLTYLKHVLVPAIKVLGSNAKEQALIIRDIIEQSRYGGNPNTLTEFFVKGGICGDWAGVAAHLGMLLGFNVMDLSTVVREPHASALLCNETWWKNQYGLRFHLRNGTVLECYLWVDTGALRQSWHKNFIILENEINYPFGKLLNGVIKIEKLVNGKWVQAYPFD